MCNHSATTVKQSTLQRDADVGAAMQIERDEMTLRGRGMRIQMAQELARSDYEHGIHLTGNPPNQPVA